MLSFSKHLSTKLIGHLRAKKIAERFLLFLVLLISSVSTFAKTGDDQIAQLRQQLSLNYLQPAPHMALAKHYRDKGDRLQAFYLLEYARRARFSEIFLIRHFKLRLVMQDSLMIPGREKLTLIKA